VVTDAQFSTGPFGDGVVTITYAPTSPTALRSSCASRKPTMVVKGPVLVRGTPGADVVVGDRGANQIDGAGGEDTICAGAGADLVKGSGGNHLLRGQSGQDRVQGGTGNDDLSDGTGQDQVAGGTGNVRIDTTSGNQDKVDCGRGRDRVNADRRDQLERCERVSRST
jgi:Ca2+-binding RTX toxin-like protein